MSGSLPQGSHTTPRKSAGAAEPYGKNMSTSPVNAVYFWSFPFLAKQACPDLSINEKERSPCNVHFTFHEARSAVTGDVGEQHIGLS